MKVLSTAGHKEGKESQRAQLQMLISSLGNGTYTLKKADVVAVKINMAFIYQEHCDLCVSVYFYDFLLLINGKQIGNLARVQDTVYIF